MVEFGKMWTITTAEDLMDALDTLDRQEFIAEMSDDFTCWRREKDEVARQRRQVMTMARDRGLIP